MGEMDKIFVSNKKNDILVKKNRKDEKLCKSKLFGRTFIPPSSWLWFWDVSG